MAMSEETKQEILLLIRDNLKVRVELADPYGPNNNQYVELSLEGDIDPFDSATVYIPEES